MIVSDKAKRTTSEKPVSLHPLNLKEALAALLKTKPPPKEDKGKTQEPSK